ncbi:alkaline phosphatase family protein [Kushneria sp. AK178]
MKYFVIGIDGASEELIEKYEMPFMKKMLETGEKEELHEDLISRGWVEIYTGQHACSSGGYYERPVAKGNMEWSKSFNLNNLDKNIIPIWKVLNDRNFSVGIMNVPTTYPTPEINGFFISGGGGGAQIKDNVPEELCYPKATAKVLNDLGYILDERVPSLLWEEKLFDIPKLIERLKEMVRKRVEGYIALYEQNPVDFGFIVFRAPVVIEYLAISDVEKHMKGSSEPFNEILVKEIKGFYRFFDEQVEKLFSSVKPEKALFVSDHSIKTYSKSVNLNSLLKKHGFQKEGKSNKKVAAYLKKKRHLIPYGFRKWIKKSNAVKKSYQSIVPFDHKKSVAFNVTQMGAGYGYYINDVDRFGGSVPADRKEFWVNEIISCLNKDDEAQRVGLTFYPKQSFYNASPSSNFDILPDIIVTMPEGCMPSNENEALVTEYKPSLKSIDLTEVKDDNWTGVKGYHPLFLKFKHSEMIDLDQVKCRDLTMTYQTILNEIE